MFLSLVILHASRTLLNILLVNLDNQKERSEVLEELYNPKSRLGISYGDGIMTKDNNIIS